MTKTIREVMTMNPETVTVDSPVADAARIMRDRDTGIVPVVDGDRLVGVVTDRDITVQTVADGRDPQTTTVGQIASSSLVMLDPEQNLDDALQLMAQHQVRRLPVCEDGGRLVGIVAQADVARHAKAKQTGEVVEEISHLP